MAAFFVHGCLLHGAHNTGAWVACRKQERQTSDRFQRRVLFWAKASYSRGETIWLFQRSARLILSNCRSCCVIGQQLLKYHVQDGISSNKISIRHCNLAKPTDFTHNSFQHIPWSLEGNNLLQHSEKQSSKKVFRSNFSETGFYTALPLEIKFATDTLNHSPAPVVYKVSGPNGEQEFDTQLHHRRGGWKLSIKLLKGINTTTA